VLVSQSHCIALWDTVVHLKSSLGSYTLKNAGLIHPKFASNMDKTKCWVKNAIKKCTVES